MKLGDAERLLVALVAVERAVHRLITAPKRYAKLSAQTSLKKARADLLENCGPVVKTWRLILPNDDELLFGHLRDEANKAINEPDQL